MVRKGGFEPPRLSAPPPQDGVSASSTTSADVFDVTPSQTIIIAGACRGICSRPIDVLQAWKIGVKYLLRDMIAVIRLLLVRYFWSKRTECRYIPFAKSSIALLARVLNASLFI